MAKTIPTSPDTSPDAAPWPRGADLKVALLERCDAYCKATGAPRSDVSLTISRSSATIGRLERGDDISTAVYDDCRAGLARLERLAGLPSPEEGPSGADLRRLFLDRFHTYRRLTGLTATRIAEDIGRTVALVRRLARDGADMRLDTYDACMTGLDRLAGTLAARLQTFTSTGVNHGTSEEEGPDHAASAGHRGEGRAVHQADRVPGRRETGLQRAEGGRAQDHP